jgi:hypothetical protein
MEYSIQYNPAAFKHGCTEADISWATETKVYDGPWQEYENKYVLIGFDLVGNPLEIMYNFIDSESINVFHAMKCRNSLLDQLNMIGEGNYGADDR